MVKRALGFRLQSHRVRPPAASRSLRLRIAAFAFLAVISADGWGLDLVAATERFKTVSAALAAADAQVSAGQERALAAKSLSMPDVSIDVRRMEFKKSLDVDLTAAEPTVTALGIPNPLQLEVQDWRTRPVVTATLPIYAGGKIEAGKAALTERWNEAQADAEITWLNNYHAFLTAYFGVQLQAWVRDIRRAMVHGVGEHLDHARKLEREGFISRAQVLQADVAYQQALRDQVQAEHDLSASTYSLNQLLALAEVRPSTPLFVVNAPFSQVAELQARARDNHPSLTKLAAVKAQTRAQIQAKEADFLPQVYAFGQYDLRPEDALITESDWAFGVGIKYQLWSSANRRRQVSAAKQDALQVEHLREDALMRLDIGIVKAHYALEAARDSFMRLQTNLAQADENLRLQSLSFREGQATSLDVIDARLRLTNVSVEKAVAAYQYDMALAQLLMLTGDLDAFPDYAKRADFTLPVSLP